MRGAVSDFLLKRLSDWGIKRIYGYPEDGSTASWARLAASKIESSSSRCGMRDGRFHGVCARQVYREVKVCLATSGPGAIHLLNALYHAKLDHESALAIVGSRSALRCAGLPAGTQSRIALQRRPCIRPPRLDARADAPPHGPRGPAQTCRNASGQCRKRSR